VEVKNYLHYIISKKKASCSSVNGCYSGIKFFYENVLGRDWNMRNVPRIKRHKKLPSVLSPREVKSLFDVTTNLKHKAILMTVYSAGLRVSEASRLKVIDIDSKSMQIIIRQGKGNKDRYSLLSNSNLEILREYFKVYKPKDWLFPGQVLGNPLTTKSMGKVFQEAKTKAGITKKSSIHTLRHSFATHLLENKTDLCYIQQLLGHSNLSTTSVYLHLRRLDVLKIISPLDVLLDTSKNKDLEDNND
jgi:integrase/recombinase XerD